MGGQSTGLWREKRYRGDSVIFCVLVQQITQVGDGEAVTVTARASPLIAQHMDIGEIGDSEQDMTVPEDRPVGGEGCKDGE
jgi:hypothetical protein